MKHLAQFWVVANTRCCRRTFAPVWWPCGAGLVSAAHRRHRQSSGSRCACRVTWSRPSAPPAMAGRRALTMRCASTWPNTARTATPARPRPRGAAVAPGTSYRRPSRQARCQAAQPSDARPVRDLFSVASDETQIGQAEVGQVGQHAALFAGVQPQPGAQRSGVLADRRAGQQAP